MRACDEHARDEHACVDVRTCNERGCGGVHACDVHVLSFAYSPVVGWLKFLNRYGKNAFAIEKKEICMLFRLPKVKVMDILTLNMS